jgi:hypothetical protein
MDDDDDLPLSARVRVLGPRVWGACGALPYAPMAAEACACGGYADRWAQACAVRPAR